MRPVIILQSFILLVLANGAPLIAKKFLGERYSYPLDGNVSFVDSRPVFGRSKTIRGIVLAGVATTAAAPVIGLHWEIGLLVAAFAMAGDLFSSFCKRRLRLPTSSRASRLDQVPEALSPLPACRKLLASTGADIAVCVVMFAAGEIALSRLLYAFRLRDRPY